MTIRTSVTNTVSLGFFKRLRKANTIKRTVPYSVVRMGILNKAFPNRLMADVIIPGL